MTDGLSQGLNWLQSSVTVEQTGWLLVHSVWQFAVIALLSLVLDHVLRRASAATRYVTLLTSMLLIIVAPVVTWHFLPSVASPPAATSLAANESPDLAAAPPESLSVGGEPASAGEQPGDWRLAANSVLPAPIPNSTATHPADPQPAKPWMEVVTDAVDPWLSALVGIWGLGVLLFSIRPVWSWCVVRRLKTVGVTPVPKAVQEAFDRMCERLRITRSVRVLQSTLASAPMVVGCFRSVILLPASFIAGVPLSQLEAILAHELAHVRRYDYLANLLQTLVETLFFYHPAVWWLSHRIRIERENYCDDLVVATLGNRVEYGRALLAIEESRGLRSVLALGVDDGSLLARVRRIAGLDTESSLVRRPVATMVSIVLLSLAGFLSVTWGFADRNHPAQLRIPNPDGSPAQFMAVVAANIGYPATTPDTWIGHPDQDGLVSLKGLPDGTHWLVVGTQQERPILFPLDVPTTKTLVEPPARPSAGSLAEDVELTAAMIDNDPELGEMIVVEFRNQSAKPQVISEDDLQLISTIRRSPPRTELFRVFSPSWLGAGRKPGGEAFPRVTLAPGETRQLRLNWSDWVRRGLWVPRSGEIIREPALPEPLLGKLWVQVAHVSGRSRPISLTAPEVILGQSEPTRLRVRNADGSPAMFNDVVEATVGLSPTLPNRWLAWPDRQGMVSLAGLSLEEHWLLAAGDAEQRTLFRLKLPAEQPVIEQRLRAATAWTSKNVDVKASVETDRENDPFIVLEILNHTPQPLQVSEADVQLHTLAPGIPLNGDRGEIIRGLSPRWSDENPTFPETTIEPGQTGRVKVRWRDWAERGLWSSRSHEAMHEPDFPPAEPGKRWVRACLGNICPLPVAVANAGTPAVSQREPLDFLQPYPKLHGLSLDITEAGFLEIVQQQELQTRKTVDGGATHYAVGLGDGHTLIVMFGNNGEKCSGIQRIRGEDEKGESDRPDAGVQAIPPALEFRIVAQATDSQLEPRVPADYAKRDYPGNSAIARSTAKDKGFVWVPVVGLPDQDIAVQPVERRLNGKVRQILLADTPAHAMPFDGKWAVNECLAAPDTNGDRFQIRIKLNEAGGAALMKLTSSHLNQPLAIVIKNEIVAAPIIRGVISSDILIAGNFNREQAEKLAAAITGKPAPQAQSFRATARPERNELMVGEPGWILFEVHNDTDSDKRAIVGGDYRNALGRPNSFQVDVFDAAGKRVPQPDSGMDFGGMSWPAPIAAKGSTVFKLFLPHWATITEPGTYRLTIRRDLDIVAGEKDGGQDAFKLKPETVAVAAETTLKIVPADDAKLGELIEQLGPVLIGEPASADVRSNLRWIGPLGPQYLVGSLDDQERANQILRTMTRNGRPDERAVPWYLKLLAQPSGSRKVSALRFLGTCQSETALDAIIRSLDVTADAIENASTREAAASVAENIQHNAAGALSTFATNNPANARATEKLFALADHPHMPIRLTVLHFAAQNKTAKARAIIDALTADKHETVAKEAKRYQTLLRDEDAKQPAGQPAPQPKQADRVGLPSVKGRVTIEGPIPVVPTLKVKPDALQVIPRNDEDRRRNEQIARNAAEVEIPDDSLVVGKDGGIANVFVYLKQVPEGWTPTVPPTEPVEIDCGNHRFQPHASIVRVGQPIRVHGPKQGADNFKLQPFRSHSWNMLVPTGKTLDIEKPFAEPELLPVPVRSDLHRWMEAWVLALDHPFAAITDANGRFEIRDVPPGEHHFTVWHERTGHLNKDLVIRVEAGRVAAADLKFPAEQFAAGDTTPAADKADQKVDTASPGAAARRTDAGARDAAVDDRAAAQELAEHRRKLASHTAELEKLIADREQRRLQGRSMGAPDEDIAMQQVRVAKLKLQIAGVENRIRPGSTPENVLESLKRDTLVRWGQSRYGVQIGLERFAIRDSYTAGDVVQFRRRVRNVGTEPLETTLSFQPVDRIRRELFSNGRFFVRFSGLADQKVAIKLAPGTDQPIPGSEFHIDTKALQPGRYFVECAGGMQVGEPRTKSAAISVSPPGMSGTPADLPLWFEVVASDTEAPRREPATFVLQGSPDIAWGEPNQGLQAGLRYSRGLVNPAEFSHPANWQWKLGETVEAEILVRNMSPTPVPLTFAVAPDDSLVQLSPHSHGVQIGEFGGAHLRRRTKSGVFRPDGHEPTDRRRTVTLQPGAICVVAQAGFQLFAEPADLADIGKLPRVDALLIREGDRFSIRTHTDHVRGAADAMLRLDTGRTRLWISDLSPPAGNAVETPAGQGQLTLSYDMFDHPAQANFTLRSLTDPNVTRLVELQNGGGPQAIDLPAGRYEIIRRMQTLTVGAWTRDVPTDRRIVTVPAGRNVAVRFERPRGELSVVRGQWPDLTTHGLAGGFLTVHPIPEGVLNQGDPDDYFDFEIDRDTVAAATCGPDGRFSLEPLPVGRYVVVLRAFRESASGGGPSLPYFVGVNTFDVLPDDRGVHFFPNDFRIRPRWNTPQWQSLRHSKPAAGL